VSKQSLSKEKMRKRFARLSVDLRLEVETETGSLHTRACNLSAKGVMFDSDAELVPGEQVHVLIYIPRGREVDLLKIRGEVIWVRREEARRFSAGTSFSRFAPGDERRLRQYLLAHIRGENPHNAPYFGREGKFD
jgi:hypothetical protein